MGKKTDLTGEKFFRLTVIRRCHEKEKEVFDRLGYSKIYWLCLCDCGESKIALTTQLMTGKSKSCGCYAKEVIKKTNTKHGMSGTKEYKTWKAIRKRCGNNRSDSYHRYGGRGIKVCDRWDSFENFYADMGDAPTPSHSIDRIDVNGNYEPSNCKWATPTEQANNRKSHAIIEYEGKRLTHAQWASQLGMSPSTIKYRLNAGFSIPEVLNPELIDRSTVFRGVYLVNGKYRVNISVKGTRYNLGRFANKEDAIKARIDAEIKYRGSPDSDRVSAVYTAHQ